MNRIYLPLNASKARQRDAARARQNRAEIVRELSWGRVSRRDLIKMGILTGAGMLAPIRGLNPFLGTVASAVSTGVPRSPMFGVQPFTQPMPRFDVLPSRPVTCLTPACQAEANQTLIPVHAKLGGGYGPCEGRPPGPIWAHQRFDEFPPGVCVQATQAPAMTNFQYNPQVPPSLNSGIDPAQGIPLQGTPKSAIFRIHRDVRFAKDKKPYKTHAGAVLTRSGAKSDPGLFYIHAATSPREAAAGSAACG